MAKCKSLYVLLLSCCMITPMLFSCVDNDDLANEQGTFYSATKRTAAEIISDDADRCSMFQAILEKSNYYSLLSVYGNYTVFAPTNEAINKFIAENSYASFDALLQDAERCDTIARTHIIKDGAYFTTDVSDGALPQMNMDDRYLVMTCDSDAQNNNQLRIFVNKRSLLVEKNDSATNGVVHFIDRVITPSNDFLPDLMAEDSSISIFVEALKYTHMDDSLTKYIDDKYSVSEDSINGDIAKVRFGGRDNKVTYPRKRYFKFTAFVEPNSVYAKKGINTLEDLKAYAKKVYDATYPEDAGKYDDDPTNRKNPLNRFVSYHLMDRMGNYSDWAPSGRFLTECTVTSLADAEDFWETMCPGTMLRFCRAGTGNNAGLYANRKGLGNKYTVKGVKVLTASESGKSEQQALNGTYLYLDDILEYSTKVRDEVLSCRMRIDATTLSADFMNQGCRFNDEAGAVNDRLYALKQGKIKGWKISDDTFVAVHAAELSWSSYLGNAICIKGQYDVQFKLPPVPSGTYEIRMGYVAGDERGVVQVYLNNEPCGIPVDLTYGTWNLQDIVGDITDTEDEEHNTAMDKTLHNLGYMRGMDSYRKPGLNSFRQDSPEHLRRILTTQKLDEGKEYWLRFRQVSKGDKEWSFDYIELCPKDVYASPDGEDRH
ncbi:MAG: fasciclin domain-containing protein [Prevotella sp.]|nr:fasciclin domain-containing protein [Prevotella sp.]